MFNKNIFNKISLFLMFSIICSILTIFTLSTTATEKSDNISLDYISEKYHLVDITPEQVPLYIKPIVFDTPADAYQFLESVHFKNKAIEINRVNNPKDFKIICENVNNINNTSIKTIRTGTQETTVASFIWGSIKMFVRYSYNDTPPKRFISCSTINTYITGFSPGLEYQQLDAWYNIIDSGRTLACSAIGHLKYYLLINGTLKLFESTDTYYHEFYL
ncbi:hypothetical protein SAMN02745221_02078 [Thermosyntropha lipolytica DSM 11003]|uniref:Uncharacterized protein n=1 Tax=Thermosyntropha lipolytica DSM 11003 TaxID=1123382 RepID=A0A1M5RPV8_9FIRM|nr:hypothetical protein [Thermosyntropha lipolytica]SHH28171.1 hypothetical protein SAMN02745221_02078 [Thermosyntropha lipolytica DSM 11003]